MGRQIRALRRRRRWRQQDLADAAGVSRSVVARIEQGSAGRIALRTLEQVMTPLGGRVVARLEWRGESLDRLTDADHAALVEQTVRLLSADGWICATEVSFNHFGERGSIDVLAYHPATGALLVIEAKSTIPDVQATLVTLDRKARVAVELAQARGWKVAAVGRLLVVTEHRTARRRVTEHEATFRSALPDRGWVVRRSIASPDPARPLAGILFLPGTGTVGGRHRVARAAAAGGRNAASLRRGAPRRGSAT